MFSDKHAKRKNKEARRFNKKKSERKGKAYIVRRTHRTKVHEDEGLPEAVRDRSDDRRDQS